MDLPLERFLDDLGSFRYDTAPPVEDSGSSAFKLHRVESEPPKQASGAFASQFETDQPEDINGNKMAVGIASRMSKYLDACGVPFNN